MRAAAGEPFAVRPENSRARARRTLTTSFMDHKNAIILKLKI